MRLMTTLDFSPRPLRWPSLFWSLQSPDAACYTIRKFKGQTVRKSSGRRRCRPGWLRPGRELRPLVPQAGDERKTEVGSVEEGRRPGYAFPRTAPRLKVGRRPTLVTEFQVFPLGTGGWRRRPGRFRWARRGWPWGSRASGRGRIRKQRLPRSRRGGREGGRLPPRFRTAGSSGSAAEARPPREGRDGVVRKRGVGRRPQEKRRRRARPRTEIGPDDDQAGLRAEDKTPEAKESALIRAKDLVKGTTATDSTPSLQRARSWSSVWIINKRSGLKIFSDGGAKVRRTTGRPAAASRERRRDDPPVAAVEAVEIADSQGQAPPGGE